MKTRALVVKELGLPEAHAVGELDIGEVGPSQCLVQIAAAGLNFPDVLIIQGKYQFKPSLPFCPGGEVSGTVKAVGAKVNGFKVGDRVIAMLGWGGFAEMAVVDAFKMIKIPSNTPMDFPTAAGFSMTYGTTIHALKQRANVQPGEWVLVLGAAGGTGLAAVELAKAMGARVIAAASTDAKLAVCKQYGAEYTINYSAESIKDRCKEITGGAGVDVVYDPVGDKYAEPAIRSMGWKGRYLVIGFAGGAIPKIPLNLTLLKGSSIVGVFWGRFTSEEPELHAANMVQLMTMIGSGKLKPLVTSQYALEDAGKAIRDMMDRKIVGKAVVICQKQGAL